MARRGKLLAFEEEELEELADMQYGDSLTFALLSLLFPFVDLRNQFHVDHIFPKTRLTKKRLAAVDVPDGEIGEFVQRRDGLANLQLLEGSLNTEKHAQMPAEWLSRMHPESHKQAGI